MLRGGVDLSSCGISRAPTPSGCCMGGSLGSLTGIGSVLGNRGGTHTNDAAGAVRSAMARIGENECLTILFRMVRGPTYTLHRNLVRIP